jgi:DNA-binding LytR/AlgR family response regulator
MQVLIIEDEKPAADKLVRALQRIDEDIRVLDVLDSVHKAVAWLKEQRADLIFLDIHLSDGLSFSIFEQLEAAGMRQLDMPIIFTTAYDEYAIKAFRLNSIDYLLKPIGRRELESSLHKFRRLQHSHTGIKQDMRSLLESLQQPRYKKRFMVSYGQRMKSVHAADIAYFYAHEKMVFMLTFERQQYMTDHTIGELDELLDPEPFFRINRKFIVNIDAIQQMHAYSKSRVKLELLPESPMDAVVSVERSPGFKAWLDR